ncbi:MAG: CopG family transcriptional regulator [Caldilinea sp. CFX5]|nr:CopG family transcriptional regulator [Caldilinea sp. CFX5]
MGQVYKVAPPALNDGPAEVRVVDATGEDYLYPAAYFEPFAVDLAEQVTATATVHLPPSLKSALHAEALAAGKSMSALLRQWIDERLDLPQQASI